MKKTGSETPARAKIMAARSKIEPRLRAEMTPTETPPTSQRIAAPMAG